MLKLNKMTDYAIVCIGILSRRPNSFMTTHQISEESGISLATVQKILKLLVTKSDFVLALRGSQGGYKLIKKASQISITHVIETIDGPINLTSCVDGAEKKCECSNSCLLEGNWNKVNEIIVDTLKSISVSDLLSPENLINFNQNKSHLQKAF